MVMYRGLWVISPDSHIWKNLKKLRKGTSCELCEGTDNLYAYRSSTGNQTLCKSCLDKAKRYGVKKRRE